eukprot:TRINITY_DN1388_c0_g1_i5.p1 TRINITY_DN1388_c0_g1~~TRINITY_DN1388_c0_g1_i5.p1  ORF type:complete len:152 (-),score=3.39 TRINITY_DN1388_c0_g1_i5:352-807(-)
MSALVRAVRYSDLFLMSGRSHPEGAADAEGFLSQAEAILAEDGSFDGGLAAGGRGHVGLIDRTCIRPSVLGRCVRLSGDNLSDKSRDFVFVRKSFRCLLGDARSRKDTYRGIAFLHFPFVTSLRWLLGQYEERMAISRWQQTWVLDRRWRG